MFALLSRRATSRVPFAHSFHIEQLETRRLLSASVVSLIGLDDGGDVVDRHDPPTALSASVSASIEPLAAKIVKLEGTFNGHYFSTTTGEHPLKFSITHCTHTGHFVGVATFTNAAGKFPADVTGVIRSNFHLDLTFIGSGFQGTMTGISTHTGGAFSGDYTVTGDVTGHGTYKVAKG
jgi:hypothetical protein